MRGSPRAATFDDHRDQAQSDGLMAERTWSVRDIKMVMRTGARASLSSALLCRIVREAADRFEEPNLKLEKLATVGTNNYDVRCTVIFGSVALDGASKVPHPTVELRAIRLDEHQVQVCVGGSKLSKPFGWLDQSPDELFLALFTCALESAGEGRSVPEVLL